MSFRTKCLIYLVITAALWSTSGVAIKVIDWNPLAIASARSLIGGLTIAIIAYARGGLRRPGRTQWISAVLVALISFCFVTATKLTTAANAILLQYTAPVWVAIAAPLILRERTSGRDWFFIALTFMGMALFFMDSLSAEGKWGMVLAIISGGLFGGLAIAVRYDKEGGPPFTGMVLGNIMVFLGGLFFWRAPWPQAGDVILLLALGVFQFGVSYYLYSLASQGVTSLELVLVTTLEPILNPVWVFLAIGEKPGHWALVGGAVVLVTVTMWSVLKSLRPSPALK